MNWKTIGKVIFALLLVAVLVAPVGALLYLSEQEQAQYTTPPADHLELKEQSYGMPEKALRKDVSEIINLSGTVISTDVVYEELDLENPSKLRLLISAGQYLQAGDPIGYYENREVPATKSGVIRSVNVYGSEPYIELWDLEKLAVECYVNDLQLKILKRSSLKLSDEEGNPYEVLRIDAIPSANGLTRVLITSESAPLIYGKAMAELPLNTGRIYTDSLVVPSRCVFSTDGGATYYVRLVHADGTVIGNSKIEIGYTMDGWTCISGIEEGQYCDSGYKAIVEG